MFRKYLFTCYLFLGLFCVGGTAIAQSCTADERLRYDQKKYPVHGWLNLYRSAKGLGIPTDRQEPTFTPMSERSHWETWQEETEKYRSSYNRGNSKTEEVNRYRYGCHYGYAVKSLRERISLFGANHPYISEWVKNREIVFSNCLHFQTGVQLPHYNTSPYRIKDAENVEKYREADNIYQTAAALYYSYRFSAALKVFDSIRSTPNSPHHAVAHYMSARTHLALGNIDSAMALTTAILDDPRLKSIHNMTEELEDVIAYQSQDLQALNAQLRRTLSVILKPAQEIRDTHSLQKYRRAFRTVEWFAWQDTPRATRSGSRPKEDWWLTSGPLRTNHGEAVRQLARQNDFLFWYQNVNARTSSIMYMDHIERHSDPGFLRIANLSWEKWKNTGELTWLIAASLRMMPDNPHINELMQAFQRLHKKSISCQSNEIEEVTLNRLYPEIVRILAMSNKTSDVLNLLDKDEFQNYKVQNYMVESKVLEWWAFQNEKKNIRALLAKRRPDTYQIARQYVAETLEEFVEPMTGTPEFPLSVASAAILNLMPLEILNEIIDYPKPIADKRKAPIIRAAWVRAYLLQKHSLLEKLSDDLAGVHPELIPYLDRIKYAKSQQERDNHATYMLAKHPRLGILITPYQNKWEDPPNLLTYIDGYNKNDNNWWCSFDTEREGKKARLLFDSAANIKPWHRLQWTSEVFHNLLRNNRNTHIKSSPLLKLVDHNELEMLSNIASGPRFLAKSAVKWSQTTTLFGRIIGTDEHLPETLHQIVKSTRYGCERDGPHGEYSQKVFRILHDNYPGSIWAKKTPYWFNCTGFRRPHHHFCSTK